MRARSRCCGFNGWPLSCAFENSRARSCCDQAPVQAPNLVLYAVAAVLGRRERSGEALLDTLLAYLTGCELVLVLDNCEHLIDACAGLAERVLSGCPMVRILATSREQLRIGGEVTWRVPSLAIPDPGAALSPADLLAYPAVRLFVDRVKAVQRDFTLGPTNASSVAGVCARLEGLPLALELAAARVPALSLPQILERLDDSLRLLVGGSRTVPTRQQTLRATLDWSYGLLGDQERTVFGRLAGFAAGWSLEAAEAVCAAGDVAADDVLILLHRLVDKSLVIVDPTSGRSRYRLLEPVRQYAHAQLAVQDDLNNARRRHALYFLSFGEQRERATSVGGPERTAATAALVQEYPNIRLALGWCLESGEGQLGLRLARTVQFMWQARGHPGEGLAWLERLLVAPGAEAPTSARAVCLLTAGRLALLLGRMEAARSFYEAGLPLARVVADTWVQWPGPQNFGLYAMACGEPGTASRYFQEALAVARTADDRIDEAISLGPLAAVAMSQGDYAQAQLLAEASRRIAHAVGEDWAESFALVRLGMIALLHGDHATAKVDVEQALGLVRRHGDPHSMALALESLGLVAVAEHEHDKAYAHLAESLRLFDDIGSREEIANNLESFAALAVAQGMAEAALQLVGAAAELREAIGVVREPWRGDLLERWLSVVRLRLAEDVYARNWAAGRELSIQKAIALALGTLPRGATDSPKLADRQGPELAGPTARELEVLRLVARGDSNKEIATELVLSVRTVERHITNLYGKIDARGKADATAYAFKHGLL
jgi:predicted ATPase/DNA-binding CsgD family transcriptional regulator